MSETEDEKLMRLQVLIGVTFNNPELLRQALTHSSCFQGGKDVVLRDNERLEWIGDSVIEGVVSDYLYATYPRATPGDLTALRDDLVNNAVLGKIAAEMELGSFMYFGRGTRASARIVCNCFEALIGAIDGDQGRSVAKVFLMGRLFSRLSGRRKHNNIVHL